MYIDNGIPNKQWCKNIHLDKHFMLWISKEYKNGALRMMIKQQSVTSFLFFRLCFKCLDLIIV